MHHPWRIFRALGDSWKLRWADLPEGILGMTDHLKREVTLTVGMTQAERRCTIAHETQHILRGHVCGETTRREERIVDGTVAWLLLDDIRKIADEMVWHRCDLEQVADALWVDEETLRVRLMNLHPAERHYLSRRLAED